MFDVVTIGSATRDVFVSSKKFKVKKDSSSQSGSNILLPLGSKLELDNIIFESGGGATNAAVTFARQGLKASCICRVGKDPGGKEIFSILESEGVDTGNSMLDPDDSTGYSLILVTESGERTVLVYRGASSDFPDHLVAKEKLNGQWLFISSLAGKVNLLKELVNWAKSQNIKIALIPGGDELKRGAKVLFPIFAKVDVVIMNREEAAFLTGVALEKKEKIIQKFSRLISGVGVITDGPYGSTAFDKTNIYHIGTHGNKALDRTGAGDAFASGFIAGLIKFNDIEGALEMAADNGSSVVNYFGAKKGILKSGEDPFKDKLKITKSKI